MAVEINSQRLNTESSDQFDFLVSTTHLILMKLIVNSDSTNYSQL